jgi:hypothetical protein
LGAALNRVGAPSGVGVSWTIQAVDPRPGIQHEYDLALADLKARFGETKAMGSMAFQEPSTPGPSCVLRGWVGRSPRAWAFS